MAKNQTLQHKRSTVTGNIPTTAQVAIGELALNFADKSIYTQTAAGTIIELARDVYRVAPASPSDGDMLYDATNDSMTVWDGTKWVNVAYSGKDVLVANTTASPTWSSGSGTQVAPYVFTITTSGGAIVQVTTFTVTGLAPDQYVPIIDLNAASNGGRFTVTNNIADSSGVLRFNIIFTDLPVSANGTSVTANFRVGTATVYINVTASIGSSFPQTVSFPTNTTAVTSSWTAAADTLTSTGDLRISLDGVTYSTGPLSITTGATLYTKWTGSAGSGLGIDGANGATITGAVVASGGGSTSSSLVIDKTPTTITFAAVTGAALSTATDSSTQTVSGVNSYVYLTSSDTVSASVAGGSFGAVPASGTSLYAVSGQTLQLRQTSSATSATTTTVIVTAGGGSTSFAVTTASIGTINTPSITSPVSGSTGISATATITSSAYAVTGVVGTHLNSDWEIYTNSALTGAAAFSSLASTTNLTTWTPTGLGYSTQYWARVRYRSTDGTAVISSYSSTVTWTTAAQPGVSWIWRSGLRSTTWGSTTTVSDVFSVVWNSNRSEYLAVGGSGKVATSPTGTTWTYQAGLSATAWGTIIAESVVWNPNRSEYLVVGQSGQSATSPDGINWTYQTGLDMLAWSNNPVKSVVWNPNRSEYLAVGGTSSASNGGKVATSPDGITWTYQAGLGATAWGTSTAVVGVVWNPNRSEYLVVGTGGYAATSPDGITWTYQAGFNAVVGNAADRTVIWNPNRLEYLAAGSSGSVATSPDGITWTNQPGLSTTTFGAVVNVWSVVWNGNQYLAAGGSGKVATSPDGVTWTYRTGLGATTWGTAYPSEVYSVVWDGSKYLAVGSQGKVATSQ